MGILVKQGKLSKWFSGYGQECISVGAALAINKDEYLLPAHRNLGVFVSRDVPLEKLFAQLMGKQEGFTKGRDRSFNFGSREHHIVGMISHLGAQLSVADGVALGGVLKKQKKVVIVFTGDGATSQGEFHEALNLAAVWSLPVIFIIENNFSGLSTPTSEQYACKELVDKAVGYGIEGHQLDGNNIVEIHTAITKHAENIRKEPRPILLECLTENLKGHEVSTTNLKKNKAELDAVDPLVQFEKKLLDDQVITRKYVEQLTATIEDEIQDALSTVDKFESPEVSVQDELDDVWSTSTETSLPGTIDETEIRFVDAINKGLMEAMEHHNNLVLMGQDIAGHGGVFKVTKGLLEKFGKERVRNTPLCESAIIGASLGLSISGMKSVIEMQFADFITCGFNQVVNNLAKSHYRWQQNADVVIRLPTGWGMSAGPFHSQTNEAWFTHTPGLKVYYPSCPNDAYHMLVGAIHDPNPVLFFEHKAMYRFIKGKIASKSGDIEKAGILVEGDQGTIITYGMGVHWAGQVLQKNNNISVDVIDLRCLLPIDYDTIYESVKKTGRVIILHEDIVTGGIGGEIAARIASDCFEFLDAPIMRIGGLDTPVPYNSELEKQYQPLERFESGLKELLAY